MTIKEQFEQKLKKAKNVESRKRVLYGIYKQLSTSRTRKEAKGEYRNFLHNNDIEVTSEFAWYVANHLYEYGMHNHAIRLRNQHYNPERIEGVVKIAGDFYTKSPESLSSLIEHLKGVGYDIKDCSKEDKRPPREVQEKRGWYLWFAALNDDAFQRKGECRTCHNLIERLGIETHEHKCEYCGDFTFVKYVNGGQIRFSIADNPEMMEDYTLMIHSFDKENERLNFYTNLEDCKVEVAPIINSKLYLSREESHKKLPELLKRFPETFSEGKIDGIKIVSVPHKDDGYVHEHGINICEVGGEKRNFRDVKIFKGKKFDGWDRIPIPETHTIYEAWHWMPLKPGPDLYERIMSAAGQVSRKDYYYQDGRPAFGQIQIDWMLEFIDQFTTIDAKKIRHYLHTGLSGPKMIDTLAKLTGHEGSIPTAPNIGNALATFGKIIEGRAITEQEIGPAIDGICRSKDGKIVKEILGDEFVDDVTWRMYETQIPQKHRRKFKKN